MRKMKDEVYLENDEQGEQDEKVTDFYRFLQIPANETKSLCFEVVRGGGKKLRGKVMDPD